MLSYLIERIAKYRKMKKVAIIPMIALLTVCLGCEMQQKGPSNLSVGKSKLVDSGLALEAVEHLEKAEQEEVNKVEPRALLLLAYSHGLADSSARSHGVEAAYKNQRAQRIAELTEAEMKSILQTLSQPSRIRKAGLQVLVDKGTPAAALMLESLVKGRYPGLHPNFTEMLVDIAEKKAGDALELILATLTAETTPAPVKTLLVRVIAEIGAEIGDEQAVDALKSLQQNTMEAGLKMEINTTLYQLGEVAYKDKILAGLSDSDVAVRRAAAKAMVNVSDVPPKSLIAGLKDSDAEVVTDLVKALAMHQDAAAVKPLMDILTGELSKEPKQATIDTLEIYAANKLARTLANDVTTLLISGKVNDTNNRLHLVLLLKREPLRRQILATNSVYQLESKLYEYYQKTEQSEQVKTTLSQLLELLSP